MLVPKSVLAQSAITKFRLNGLNNRNLSALKGRMLKIRCPLIQFLVRTLFLVAALLLCPYVVFSCYVERERERESQIFLKKARNASRAGPHCVCDFIYLNYLLEALYPNVITLGVRAST